MTSGLVLNPLGEKLAIGQLSAVGDLGGGLGLAGVEAEKGGYGGDHICHGQTIGASGHDVGAIKLNGGKGDAAFCLAKTRLDEGADQRLDGTTGWAPRGGPECQERDAGGRGHGEISLKGVIVANSTSLGGVEAVESE